MKKLLLLFAALFSAAIPMTAQTGSLIREDRVWEYEGDIPIGPWFQYKMRFDGDTVIDGTRYNILHTFDCIAKEGPEEVPAKGMDFFMREEDGRVYVLVGDPFWPVEHAEEKLLYDFNVETDDELDVVDNTGELVNMAVTFISRCSINGEDCKVYTMVTNGEYNIPYTVVEGIGNASMGCMPFFTTDFITGGSSGGSISVPVGYVDEQLKRVYDNEGNVICERDSNGLWPWENRVYIPFIQQDRVWEYATTYTHSDFSDSCTLHCMRFDGNVEVNGHSYSKFVNFKATEYPNGLGKEGNEVAQESLKLASYYREDGKTVYILMKDGFPAVGDIDLTDEYTEAVMMDFSLKERDIFPPELFAGYDGITDPLRIRYTYNYTEYIPVMRGICFELYSTNDKGYWTGYRPVFGEGVGLTNDILPDIEPFWSTSDMESFLLTVRDGGEFLYKDRRYDLMVNGTDYVSMISDDPTTQIHHTNGVIEAYAIGTPVTLTLYDASGALVASTTARDRAAIATDALQSGVYIARAAGESLKILVK